MKRTISLLFFLINLSYLLSNPIDIEKAKLVTTNFMNSKRLTTNTILNVVLEKYNKQSSFYVVNFREGGWVMVSSDNSTVPVLGYSFEGVYKVEDQKPEAFIELINGYKKQIQYASELNTQNSEIIKKWDSLVKNSQSKSIVTYTPGTRLLNVPGRGQIQWSQDYNNDGGCFPSYHRYCPSGSGQYCYCGRKSAGCGAVAMGQIMWYWQWPLSSSYRTYNWSIMPPELTNASSTEEGDGVAHLLRDCGLASDMTYWCVGSWTFTNKIEDAFRNTFNYLTAKKFVRSEWDYGSAWEDLLRSEIDNNRPVLYRGDKCDLCLGQEHFCVIDGYDALDPDFFWFNFGWGFPGYSYNISCQYLDDLTPGDHEYNENQQAIVGISPTVESNLPWDITDVPYTSVTGTITEAAENNISLPSYGKSLTIEDGGDLTLIAGNIVTLNAGFHAKSGSMFTAKIDPEYSGEMLDITVPTWTNVFTPNGDGINDELCFVVENADSWEFEAFDLYNSPIFQSAGTISGSTACVWDGAGALYCNNYYACIIRFKNSYGRAIENSYMVYVICETKSGSIATYTENISDSGPKIEIYPNPSSGIFFIKSFDNYIDDIKVYNSSAQLIFEKTNINLQEFLINLENSPEGLYYVNICIKDQLITRKIIKN